MIIFGTKTPILFGVHDLKPIAGLPAGRVRIRMRTTDFVKVFVRNDSGIQSFLLYDHGDLWIADRYEANHKLCK